MEYFFLPAAGVRNTDGGFIGGRGSTGLYWTSSINSATSGMTLFFAEDSSGVLVTARLMSDALTIRCVRKSKKWRINVFSCLLLVPATLILANSSFRVLPAFTGRPHRLVSVEASI